MIKNKIIPQHNYPNNSLQHQTQRGYKDVSFSGLANNADFFSLKLQYKKLCSKEEFNKILDLLDPTYKEYYEQILLDFRKTVKDNPNLFQNIPENIRTEIQNGHVISRPQKGVLGRLGDAILAPITSITKTVKNKFSNGQNISEKQKLQEIDTNLANIEGLVEYVNNLKEKNPEKVKQLLREKIRKNFTKIKANYSSNLSSTLTDLATFLVAAGFNACDFYNITRKAEDDHKAAMKEAKLKVKQDAIRMAILTYLTYVITSVFKKGCNRSMTRMLAVASAIQLISEIITRKSTGRPVLPINDKSLKTHLMKEKNKKENEEKTNKSKQPSFKGNFMKTKVSFSKNDLQNILNITEKIDSSLAKRYTNLIEEKTASDLNGKKLKDIFANNTVSKISLGEKESITGKIIRCIFIPVTAPVKLIKKWINKGKSEIDELAEVRNYLSFLKRLLDTKYKGKDVINNKENFNEFKKDVMNAALASFRTTEANYDTANYSIIKRIFSYTIFTTFIACDAYNVTMLHSDGDKRKSLVQSKQRIIQEITRFFISMYTASAYLTMFGKLYNKALANAFGLTVMTSTINNALTRKILGRPILPTDKKHLDEQDERNSKSGFHKTVNKLTNLDKNKKKQTSS